MEIAGNPLIVNIDKIQQDEDKTKNNRNLGFFTDITMPESRGLTTPIVTPDIGDDDYGEGYAPGLPHRGAAADVATYKSHTQGDWQKFVNMMGRGVAKAAISAVEPVGHLLDVEQIFTDINTSEEAYGNWLNQLLRQSEDYLDKSMPIYVAEDEPNIGSKDWWFKNGDQMIKSVGYLVPGLGIAKGAGAILKGMNLAGKSSRLASAFTSATAMNYSEHMLSAAQTFDDNKKKYFDYFKKQGYTKDAAYDLAKEKASGDAEDLVMKGKLNIFWQTLEYYTLFKTLGLTRGMSNVGIKSLGKTLGIAGGSEYMEEVYTGFLEQESREVADIFIGDKSGLLRPNPLRRYGDRLTTYESITEGLSGFIGGVFMGGASTAAQYKSYLKAREQLENNKKDMSATGLDDIADADFIQILYKNAIAGTFKDVHRKLDAISGMSTEEAKTHDLRFDYVEKAQELKQTAEEFEYDYNRILGGNLQNKPAEAGTMLNLYLNQRKGRKAINEAETNLAELRKLHTDIDKANPFFKANDLLTQAKATQTELNNNAGLLNQLANSTHERTINTNETAKEIEARNDVLIDHRNKYLALANEEIAKVYEIESLIDKKGRYPMTPFYNDNFTLEQKLSTKPVKAITKTGETVVAMKPETHANYSPNKTQSKETEILDNFLADITTDNELEAALATEYVNAIYGHTMATTSANMISRFEKNPAALTRYTVGLQDQQKATTDAVRDIVSKLISKAESVEVVENILKDIQDPILAAEAANKIEALTREAKAEKTKSTKSKTKKITKQQDKKNNSKVKTEPKPEPKTTPKPTEPKKQVTPKTTTEPKSSTSVKPLKEKKEDVSKLNPVQTNVYEVTNDKKLAESVKSPTLTQFKKAVSSVNKGIITKLKNKGESDESIMARISKRTPSNPAESKLFNKFNTYLALADAKTKQEVKSYITSLKKGTYHEADLSDLRKVEGVELALTENDKTRIVKLHDTVHYVDPTVYESPAMLSMAVDSLYKNFDSFADNFYMMDQVGAFIKAIDTKLGTSITPAEKLELEEKRDILKITLDTILKMEGVQIETDATPAEPYQDGQPLDTLASPENVYAIFGNSKEEGTSGRIYETGKLVYIGKKIINGASAVAYLSTDYVELVVIRNGKPVKLKADINTTKTGTLNDIIESAKVKKGTKLRVSIDTELTSGTVTTSIAEHLEDSEYTGGTDYTNEVPLKIEAFVDNKWQKIGYIHTVNWVEKNVANFGNNVAEQAYESKVMRKDVIERLKTLDYINGIVTDKTMGHPRLNYLLDENGNIWRDVYGDDKLVGQRTSDAMPDDSVMAILVDGEYFISEGNRVDGVQNIHLNREFNGLTAIIVTAPNGQNVALPIITDQIIEDNTLYNSLVTIIDLYFSDTPLDNVNELYTKLYEKTFDKLPTSTLLDRDNISTLDAFLNQYLFMNTFDLSEDKGRFKIGTFGNDSLMLGYETSGITTYAKIKKGKVTFRNRFIGETESSPISKDTFLEIVKENVANQRLSIKRTKINTPNKVLDVRFSFTSKGGYTIDKSTKTYDNYNAFVKDNTRTIFDGTHKDSSGNYNYFNQPNVLFSLDLGKTAEQVLTPEDTIELPFADDTTHGDIGLDNSALKNFAVGADESNMHKEPAYIPQTLESQVNLSAFYVSELGTPANHRSVINSVISKIIRNYSKEILGLTEEFGSMSIFGNIYAQYLYNYNNVFKDRKFSQYKLSAKQRLEREIGISNSTQFDNAKAIYEQIIKPNIWAKVVTFTLRDLKGYGVETTSKLELEGEESIYNKLRFGDDIKFKINPVGSMGIDFKMLLRTIPEYKTIDGKHYKVRTILGDYKLVDFTSIYNRLLNDLMDTPFEQTFEELLGRLSNLEKLYPQYKDLIAVLNGDATPEGMIDKLHKIQSQFVNAVSSHRRALRRLAYNFPNIVNGLEIGTKSKLYYNNERFGSRVVIQDWLIKQIDLPIVKGKDATPYFDITVINKTEKDYIKFIKDYIKVRGHKIDKTISSSQQRELFMNESFANVLSKYLNKLGIFATPMAVYDVLLHDIGESRLMTSLVPGLSKHNNGYMEALFNSFRIEAEDNKGYTNVLSTSYMGIRNAADLSTRRAASQFVRALAKAEYTSTTDYIELVAMNAKNDMNYEVQDYSHISDTVRRLKGKTSSLRQLKLNNTFSSESKWLNKLENDKEFLSEFKVDYFDASTDMGAASLNRPDMGRKAQNLFAINTFQIGRFAGYTTVAGITLGDSQHTLMLTVPEYTESVNINYKELENTSIQIMNIADATYTELLEYILNAEINRIVKHGELVKAGKISPYNNYNKGASKFIFYPQLNLEYIEQYLPESITIDDIYIDGQFNPSNKGKLALHNIAKTLLNTNLNSFMEELIEDGVVTIDQSDNVRAPKFNGKYLQELTTLFQGLDKNLITHQAVADFYIQSIIANAEQYMLFAGDPAIYTKLEGGTFDFFKTIINMQKRARGMISPRIRGNFESSTYNKIIFEDLVPIVQLQEYTEVLNDKLAYIGYEATDSGEVITTEEYIDNEMAYGRIDDAIYKSIKSKIAKSVANGTYTYELTPKELGIVFRAMKPMEFSEHSESEFDLIMMDYVKTSAIPLIPNLTKNKSIDKIRILMEKGLNGVPIQRAAFASSYKSGKVNVINILDEDNKIKSDIEITEDNILTGFRNGYGLQQHLPVGKSQILIISQLDKLLFDGIRDEKGFKYKGESLNGRQLEEKKQAIIKELYNIEFKGLLKEIGAELVDNNEVRFIKLHKLIDILDREADARNWNKDILKELGLSHDGTSFRIPLMFVSSPVRIEKLLLSIITNRIIKQKFPGFGYVQTPDIGYTNESSTTIIDYDKLSDAERQKLHNQVIFVEGYDDTTRLSPVTSTNSAQVIVPFSLQNNFGDTLQLTDFTKVINGKLYIDKSKIPKEMFNLPSSRIPGQSHSSSLPLEVVGFLPEGMDGIIVVPHEIVNQMGADFDFDKMYAYYYSYIQEDNGSLKLVTLDNYKELYQDYVVPVKIEYARLKRSLQDKTNILSGNILTQIENKIKAVDIELLNIGLTNIDSTKENKKLRDDLAKTKHKLSNTLKSFDNIAGILAKLGRTVSKKAALKNEYVHILNIALNHSSMFKHMIKPLENDDILNEHNKLMLEAELPLILTWQYQRDAYSSQQSADKLISTAALLTPFNSAIQDFNLSIIRRTQDGTVPITFEFSLGKNNILKLSQIGGSATSMYNGKVERTKTDNMVTSQNAIIDNANNPFIGDLNLNNITSNAYMLMLFLQTSDNKALALDTIYSFITQPIIRDYVEEVNRLTNEGAKYIKAKQIASDIVIKKYADENGNVESKDNYVIPTANTLVKYRKEHKTTKQYNSAQRNILQVFLKLDTYGQKMGALRSALFHSTTNGAGEDILDVSTRLERFYLNYESDTFEGTDKLFGELNGYDTSKVNQYTASTILSTKLANSLFGEMFGYTSELVNNIIKFHTASLNLDKSDVTSYVRRTLARNLKLAIMSGLPDIYKTSSLTQLRKDLIFGNEEEDIIPILERINNISILYPTNKFLKGFRNYISTEIDDRIPNFSLLATSTRELESLMLDFVELAESPESEVRELSTDLIKLAYLRGGAFGKYNFVQYIPFEYKDRAGIFDTLAAIDLNETEISSNKITINPYVVYKQMIQHFPSLATTIEYANIDDIIQTVEFKNETIPTEFIGNRYSTKKGEYSNFYNIFKDRILDDDVPLFVRIRMDNGYFLYEHVGLTADNGYVYRLIDTLGNGFRGIYEFDLSKFDATSELGFGNGITFTPTKVNPNTKLQDLLGLSDYFGEYTVTVDNLEEVFTNKDISESLNEVKLNDAHSVIAQVVKSRIKRNKTKLQINNKQLPKHALAEYGEGELNIDIAQLQTRKYPIAETERVVTHEGIHVALDSDIVNYYDGNLDPLSETYLTIERLEKLMSYAEIKLVVDDVKAGEIIDSVKRKIKLANTSKVDSLNLTTEEAKYYGFINLREFVTEVLTNSEFQDILNKQDYTEDTTPKTLLDKIFSLLFKYIRALFKETGIDVKQDTVLYYSLVNTLNLINNNEKLGDTTFLTSKYRGYKSRTIQNARYGDLTPLITIDSESPGSKLTRYHADTKTVELNAKMSPEVLAEVLVARMNKHYRNNISLNFAGNGVASFISTYKDATSATEVQTLIDDYGYRLLKAVINNKDLKVEIRDIRTGGQTGIDEAMTKAAKRLGITNSVVASSDWKFRSYNMVNGKPIKFDIFNEEDFKARFEPDFMYDTPIEEAPDTDTVIEDVEDIIDPTLETDDIEKTEYKDDVVQEETKETPVQLNQPIAPKVVNKLKTFKIIATIYYNRIKSEISIVKYIKDFKYKTKIPDKVIGKTNYDNINEGDVIVLEYSPKVQTKVLVLKKISVNTELKGAIEELNKYKVSTTSYKIGDVVRFLYVEPLDSKSTVRHSRRGVPFFAEAEIGKVFKYNNIPIQIVKSAYNNKGAFYDNDILSLHLPTLDNAFRNRAWMQRGTQFGDYTYSVGLPADTFYDIKDFYKFVIHYNNFKHTINKIEDETDAEFDIRAKQVSLDKVFGKGKHNIIPGKDSTKSSITVKSFPLVFDDGTTYVVPEFKVVPEDLMIKDGKRDTDILVFEDGSQFMLSKDGLVVQVTGQTANEIAFGRDSEVMNKFKEVFFKLMNDKYAAKLRGKRSRAVFGTTPNPRTLAEAMFEFEYNAAGEMLALNGETSTLYKQIDKFEGLTENRKLKYYARTRIPSFIKYTKTLSTEKLDKNGELKDTKTFITNEELYWANIPKDPIVVPNTVTSVKSYKSNLTVGQTLTTKQILEDLQHNNIVTKTKYHNVYWIKKGTTDFEKGRNELLLNIKKVTQFNATYGMGRNVVELHGRPTGDQIVIINKSELKEANRLIEKSKTYNRNDKLFAVVGETRTEVDDNITSRLPINIQEMIIQLQSRRYEIDRNITAMAEPLERAAFQQRKDELTKDIETLKGLSVTEAVPFIAERQLNFVRTITTANKVSTTDIYMARAIVDMWAWDNVKNYMSVQERISEKSPANKMYSKISKDAHIVAEALRLTIQKFGIKVINEETGLEATEEDIKYVEEESAGVAYFLDPSKYKNKISKAIFAITALANRQSKQFAKAEQLKITDMFAPIKVAKYKHIRKGGYDIFWEKDSEGNPTGGLTHMYSGTWWEFVSNQNSLIKSIREMRESSNPNISKLRQLIKHFYENWNTRALTIDISRLGYAEDDTGKVDSEYRAELENELGVNVDIILNEAKLRYDKYLDAKTAQEEIINTDETIDNKDTAITDWIEKNSPFMALKKIYHWDEAGVKDIRTEGYKYLNQVPKRTVEGKDTGYYSKDFEIIKSDPVLYDFYKMYNELMQRFMGMLPDTVSNRLPYNYLANIQRDMVADYIEGGAIQSLKNLDKGLANALTSNEISELNKKSEGVFIRRDPMDGQILYDIPIKYTGNKRTEKDVKDLEVLIRLFSYMAVNYYYKSTVEPKIQIMNNILKEAKYTPKKHGVTQLDKIGKMVATKLGAENVKGGTLHTIEALQYGMTKREEGEAGVKLFGTLNPFNSSKMRTMRQIEKQRDELEDKLDRRDVSQADYEAQMKVLEENYRELGGKNLSYLKIGEATIRYVQMLGMGLNLTAGIANLFFGIVSNIVHAGGRVDYTPTDARKAFGVMLSTVVKRNTKAFNIMKNLDVTFEVIDSHYGIQAEEEKFKKVKIEWYIIQRKTEFFVQGMNAVAMMMNKIVQDKNGNDISLWDAYDKHGNLRTDLMGDTFSQDWSTITKPGKHNAYTKFRDKVIQVNKINHGNYDTTSPMYAKKALGWRMIMIFRSWIPEGFATRFIGERDDTMLGRKIKGRYNTYKELGFQKSTKTMWNMMFNHEAAITGLDPVDQENMGKNLMEIKMLVALYASMQMLRGVLEADEEEPGVAGFTGRIIAAATYRAYADILFYVDPLTFYQILRDPIPVTRPITQGFRAVQGTYNYFTNPDYRGQPPLVKWSKTIPIASQIPKTIYLGTNIQD